MFGAGRDRHRHRARTDSQADRRVVGQGREAVEDTAAHTYKGDRNAAELCERLVGVASGEAKRAIETATRSEALPLTAAAVAAGRLSARPADLIASTAADDPAVEGKLLKSATGGMVKLRDECIAVRARREDQAARAKRQHWERSFQMWPTFDWMTCESPGVGPVNVEWVQGLLGSAFVTAVVKKGKDITTVAHLGRHVAAELRTALIVSGRECSVEGCTGREYLELDHCEIDYAKDGPTAWGNLTWLCSIHHTRKTQGWSLGPPDPATGKRQLEPLRNEAGRAA